MTKQTSKRHHYLPQFYLKQWRSKVGAGIFNYIKKQHGEIKTYTKYEKSCGFEFDLYTLRPTSKFNLFNYQPDYIEEGFFKKLDNEASIVHKKLLATGLENLTIEDKSTWALFLRSLMERNPERINEVFQFFDHSDLKSKVMSQINDSEYGDYFDVDVMQKNEILLQMTREICNPKFLEVVINMCWLICDCSATGEFYITSDTPLLINGGIEKQSPPAIYSIALSPSKLLVIHMNDINFDGHLFATIAFMHNVMMVKNAKSCIYSNKELNDTKHFKFSKFLPEMGNSTYLE